MVEMSANIATPKYNDIGSMINSYCKIVIFITSEKTYINTGDPLLLKGKRKKSLLDFILYLHIN